MFLIVNIGELRSNNNFIYIHFDESETTYIFYIFQSEYKILSDKCKDYAVELLDLCRTEGEVIAALHGDSDPKDLSRIRLAIQYEQRRVSECPLEKTGVG